MANYYLAGGKLYFKRLGATGWTQIGGAEEVKVSAKVEYADVFDHTGTLKKNVKKIPKKIEATLTFKTTDLSPAHLAMFFLGTNTVSTKTDVEAEWVDRDVSKIAFAKDLLIEGAFKFISANASGKQMVLEVYKASVAPDGDLMLQNEDVANISFTGTVMVDDSGNYADLYVDEEI